MTTSLPWFKLTILLAKRSLFCWNIRFGMAIERSVSEPQASFQLFHPLTYVGPVYFGICGAKYGTAIHDSKLANIEQCNN